MVEANMCSYEDFPKSELKAEGMKTIEANRQPRYSQVLWNVEYAKKDGYPLHLQIILPQSPEGMLIGGKRVDETPGMTA